MKLYISIGFLLLAGCKSTPQSDHQLYFKGTTITDVNFTMVHNDFGINKNTEDPLQSTYAKCINKAYIDQSVSFNDVNITSANSLNNMFTDYIMYRLTQVNGLFLPTKQFTTNDYYMFKNVDFTNQVAKLEASYKQVSKCLKSNGWAGYRVIQDKKS